MVIQRFGGGPGDNRTSMNYTVAREDGDDGIFQELGALQPWTNWWARVALWLLLLLLRINLSVVLARLTCVERRLACRL